MPDENTLENLKRTLRELDAEDSKPADPAVKEERERELKEHEANLNKLIAMDPDSFIVHSSLAGVYEDQGRYKEAEAEYRKAIELNPENFNLHYDLAQFYFDNKRFEEAKPEYEKAVEIGLPEEIGDQLHYDLMKDSLRIAKENIATINVDQTISSAMEEEDKIKSLRNAVDEFKRYIDSGIEEALHVYTAGVVTALKALKKYDSNFDSEELRQASDANFDAERNKHNYRDDTLLDRLFDHARELKKKREEEK